MAIRLRINSAFKISAEETEMPVRIANYVSDGGKEKSTIYDMIIRKYVFCLSSDDGSADISISITRALFTTIQAQDANS